MHKRVSKGIGLNYFDGIYTANKVGILSPLADPGLSAPGATRDLFPAAWTL